MTQLREYLKFKYSAPPEICKCGNCQLVPLAVLGAAANERNAMVKVLETVRGDVVLAIAFLGRDAGTDRLSKNLPAIIERLAMADKAALAALASIRTDCGGKK